MVSIEWKMTIPNALSLFRIALVPAFAVLYLCSGPDNYLLYWALGILVLSGLTDSFDGIIARKFNQITDLGKLLDPIADKLTQVTVVLCLAIRNTYLIPLLIICVVKELGQSIGGLILLHRGEKIQGAKWYGKVSTFVFYGVMALIVLWDGMPLWLSIVLVSIVAALMLFAFFNYMKVYCRIRCSRTSRRIPAHPRESGDGSCGGESGRRKGLVGGYGLFTVQKTPRGGVYHPHGGG